MSMCEKIAVQIDLARQIETIPTVKRYFDEAAAVGMNTIVMYLEDRIKTKTYPYADDVESYSEDDIRELVAYGEKLGLELIPVVSPIGHTERFLKHPELNHLRELAYTDPEKVDRKSECTCPSRQATYDFFDAYITEVAALFPSKLFHVGFDEIWNLGMCDLCSKRAAEEGLAVLYRDAVVHFCNLLKGLGKDLMMWDDMLEQNGAVFNELPRNIVFCPWFYHYYSRNPEARFNVSRRYDSFKMLERYGFRYFCSTYEMTKSIETLTEYARKYHPYGMLMTSWELSDRQTMLQYPSMAYCGALWAHDEPVGMETLLKVCRRYTTTEEAAQVLATATAIDHVVLPLPGEKQVELRKYSGMVTDVTNALLEERFETMEGETDVLDAYRERIWRARLHYEIRTVHYLLFEYRTGEKQVDPEALKARLAVCRQKAEKLDRFNHALWDRVRPGLPCPALIRVNDNITKTLDRLESQLATAKPGEIGRFDVHYCLPEYTSSCFSEGWLHYADGTKERIFYGIYKSMYEREPYYDFVYEIAPDKVPVAITLGARGFGGTGYCYADVTLPGVGRLIPQAVKEVHGRVDHPEFLLVDDSRAAILCDQDMLEGCLHLEVTKQQNSVTVTLVKE